MTTAISKPAATRENDSKDIYQGTGDESNFSTDDGGIFRYQRFLIDRLLLLTLALLFSTGTNEFFNARNCQEF